MQLTDLLRLVHKKTSLDKLETHQQLWNMTLVELSPHALRLTLSISREGSSWRAIYKWPRCC